MNERCTGCGHSPAFHEAWGAGACEARSCACQKYLAPPLYATPDLSPDEAATVARFDAAPDAPESLRQRVAAAIWERFDPPVPWESVDPLNRDGFLIEADVAIAVMRGDS